LAGYPTFLRADYNYVGSYHTNIDPNRFQEEPGDYGKLNLRAGIAVDQFTVEVYSNNLTNEDAVVVSQSIRAGDEYGQRLSPRVIGVDIGYKF